jgi:hypothetical protein
MKEMEKDREGQNVLIFIIFFEKSLINLRIAA